MAVGADRLAGYRDGLDAAGLEAGPWPTATGPTPPACTPCARLLDQRPTLDAVFVASDIMAAGALHALRRAGRRVPDDVAVVGFDDLALAAYTRRR